ncbi:NIDO domain, partial [Trinorchestia longiramus]
DPMLSRISPSDDTPYAITKERLDEIRARLMYPYYDLDNYGGTGDLQEDITAQNTQVNKQLTFLLPFFGFGLNYTWVSLNGYLGFSNAPFSYQSYPLTFPVPDWPSMADPSFIGPFYSKCNIGSLKSGETTDQQKPGVYWRLERDLPARSDQMGVELRERIKWDVREGMVGAEIFNPKHLIIVTWKNVTFAGGYANSRAREVTNTFQLLVVTDEVRSYAIFNYEKMSWTSHTEAGGSADEGQGGTPAFVGFNAGNGTRSFEYAPYSQTLYIRDLAVAGKANHIPGRHIFRMDEVILPGCCRREETLKTYPLTFAPENANMLGGTLINVTGPCFETSYRVECLFDTTSVEGQVIDSNTAVCITPRLFVTGYVNFAISVNDAQYYWNGRIFIETPLTAPEGIWFTDKSYQERSVESFQLQWLAGNLTQRAGAQASIHLYGYRELSIKPDLEYIGEIITTSNDDREKIPVTIDTSNFASLDLRNVMDFEMGLLMANLTQPEQAYNLPNSPQIWSKPIPLAWYFNSQWERSYGTNWPAAMCDRWIETDRNLRNFAYETDRCPCLLKQAIQDRGRFLPDFSCDQFGNSECDYHFGAIHCVRSALPNKDGAGQQCCYDRDGYLMMTADTMWGGNPHRAHNLGKTPFNEANKVPSLSHWYYDVIPFFTCCKWQTEQSPGCTTYRFERRAAQDCVGYQVPSVATVFGDPHFYTFDDTQYTFNGKGEFVLTRVDSVRHVLDVQGRFEQIDENYLGGAKATLLTAVAARDNVSSVVEIRRRPIDAIWRYHLDVIVDGRRVYFDRYSQKIQQFRECIVYTPSNILNQSQVVVMFSSGAGVEVQENYGFLGMRVFLPLSFANITSGLFGNWTFDPEDDYVLPDGTQMGYFDTNNFKTIHEEFGMKWVLDDKEDEYKGKSLFTHEYQRSSNYYYDANFVPEFEKYPVLSENATTDQREIDRVCGDSYQCNFDFVTTLRRDFAVMTKYYQDQFVNIKDYGLLPVISCGALPTPPHGRKSTFNFLSGAEVKFDCDPGYVLLGEQRRWCYASGDWNWPEDGEATCVTEQEYQTMTQGIVAGTVLAVLVPLAIALVCFICHLRISRREKQEEQEFDYVAPQPRHQSTAQSMSSTIPKKSFSNSSSSRASTGYPTIRMEDAPDVSRVPVENATLVQGYERRSVRVPATAPPPDSDESDLESEGDGDSLNAPSSYDGEYDTNEPLDNKPVTFTNVLWEIPPNRH